MARVEHLCMKGRKTRLKQVFRTNDGFQGHDHDDLPASAPESAHSRCDRNKCPQRTVLVEGRPYHAECMPNLEVGGVGKVLGHLVTGAAETSVGPIFGTTRRISTVRKQQQADVV